MAKCHYCKQELETGEYLETEKGFASAVLCKNEDCDIHRMKNLYFKPWFMTQEQIKERLVSIDVPWKWTGMQFSFFVTPETNHDVREKIAGLNRENGSILFDGDIDYVFSSPEEIEQQIRDTWGPGEPIIIRSYPTDGNKDEKGSDSLGDNR